jgi:hypothetical protein
MSEFEDRLCKATARAQGVRDQAEAARSEKAAGRAETVGKVIEAVGDWNGRIAPIIMQVVPAANQLIAATGLQLRTQPDTTHSWEAAGHNSPSMPNLPKMRVSAVDSSSSIAPAAREQTRNEPQQATPYLEIGIDVLGKVVATTHGFTITGTNPTDVSEVDEKKIQSIIADYVDALVP